MSTFDPEDGFDDDEVENLTPQQVADAAAKRRIAEKKARDKDSKALQAELEELRAFKATLEAEKRSTELGSVFEELELRPRWAKHYPEDAPTDKDSIRKWAIEEEYLVPEESKDEPEERPFRPITSASSTQVGSSWTPDDLRAALASGDNTQMKAAAEAIAKGHVQKP